MQQIGPYRVLEELGRGGMGVVYRGQDSRDGRTVALKVLLDPTANLELLERFRREVQSLRGVEHPNLVRVLDLSLQPPRPCAVFEYVAGGTLKARVERQGPLPWPTAVQLVAEVAAGVTAVHERGLLHRDIKPENVLLGMGGAKLGDFGLVKDLNQESMTQSGTTLGTPSFMAPEQVDSEKDRWGEATDVYGLAATLYFALTGVPPFRGSTFSILKKVLEDPPEPPRKHVPGIPDWLNAAVLRGLAKRGGDRFPSALAFRSALLEGAPEREPPRRPWLLPATAGLLAIAAGAIGVGFSLSPAPSSVASEQRQPTDAVVTTDPPELSAYVASGEEKARADDHEGARAAFDRALELDPDCIPALTGRAAALCNLGLFTSALSDCERVLQLDPRLSEAYVCRAVSNFSLGHPEAALRDCDHAIELNPRNGKAYRIRTGIKLKRASPRTNWAAMIEDCDTAIELQPGDADAYALRGSVYLSMGGRDQAALEDLEKALSLDPDLGPAYACRGKLYAIRGDTQAALLDLGRALKLEPTAEAYTDRGLVHLGFGQLELAVADFDRSLELQPSHAATLEKRAEAKVKLGDIESALSDLDRALQQQPSAGAYARRARLNIQLKRHGAALEDTRLALALNPSLSAVHGLRGQALALLDRHAEALSSFDQALAMGVKEAALTYMLRAKSRVRVGRHEEAIHDFDRAVELKPTDPIPLHGRGNALFDLGRHAEALADYTRALEFAPDDPALHEEAAQAQAALGDLQSAVRHLDAALSRDPARAPAFALRGTAYARLNKHAAAVADFDRALSLSPGSGQQHGFRGMSRRVLGDLRGALEDFEQALALGGLDPNLAAGIERERAKLLRDLGR